MPEIADLIKETTATTGTGLTITLTAEANYGRLADAFAVNDVVFYVIRSGNDTEVGEGTVKAGNTLDRTTPLVTVNSGVWSNITPARIPLAGVSTVAIAPTAEAIIAKASLDGAVFTGNVTVPNLITTGNVDGRDVSVDGAKLDGIATNANNYSHPNHTGDVTSTGDGATVIANNAVTLAKMADMATASLLGRNTAGTGDPEVLSAATARTLLGLVIGTNVQAYDVDTTKNDAANVFTTNQKIYHNATNTHQFQLEQDGTGDAGMLFTLTGVKNWMLGVDNSDADKFKINNGSTVGASDDFVIDASGNTSLGGGLTIAGQTTVKETAVTEYNLTGTVIDPANGDVQYKTLTGNTTFTESLENGQGVQLMIDDGTAYTITWPAITWRNNGGVAPTLAATGYTAIYIFQMNGTLYGLLLGDGS